MENRVLRGIAASQGIAIGKSLVIQKAEPEVAEIKLEDASAELERFRNAVKASQTQLEKISRSTRQKLGDDSGAIFESHILILSDPEFIGIVEQRICSELVNAEYALDQVTKEYLAIFESMDNEYMRERAADVRDIFKRLINNLQGIEDINLINLDCERIIVAGDLTPSETAQLDKDHAIGFVVETGGRTSHTAIMARTMEIPAVMGVTIDDRIKNGELLILDGDNGVVIADPDPVTLAEYENRKLAHQEKKKELETLKGCESVTSDGRKLLLTANIGSPGHTEAAVNNGAEGIGLYRTEFLYMEGDAEPSEEKQFQAYRKVLQDMQGKPVVIRTLDIGGDKQLSYLDVGQEANPFLGYRAIRICLDKTDLFKKQLRALYRASAYGSLKVMFPMISGLEEMRGARRIAEEVKNELDARNIPYGKVELGIMIEIPSAALISDILAKEADFFSIGTNDLIQYTVAVDRMNERVSDLYDPCHIAVLRLIKLIIDNAHKEGKHVGMCGEMAGDLTVLPVLVGLGLDEFSMSAPSILGARKLVRNLNYQETKKIAAEALKMSSSAEVREYLEYCY